MYPEYELTDYEVNEYLKLISKRADKMPVQYILNNCEFMSLPFYVDENVLIPRPDTEILVEMAIDYFVDNVNSNNNNIAIEIGSGSGCIPISIAYYVKNINIISADISRNAIEISKRNAKTNNVEHNITFIESNLFDKIPDELKGNIDAVISNPPYIESAELMELGDNVINYEPLNALDGGNDGICFYREIVKNSKEYLKANGALFFEIGYNQTESVTKLLEGNNFEVINIMKDLSGINRAVYALYKGRN